MGDVRGYHQCIGSFNLRVLGLVQYVYVMARGEPVRVALRVRMDLSVGPEWAKWALDRGSGGSGFPNPYGLSDR